MSDDRELIGPPPRTPMLSAAASVGEFGKKLEALAAGLPDCDNPDGEPIRFFVPFAEFEAMKARFDDLAKRVDAIERGAAVDNAALLAEVDKNIRDYALKAGQAAYAVARRDKPSAR